MFVITGRHKFFKKIIAYRGDYCLSCDSHTVSERRRTFDFFHLYYVPVVPLGIRRRWHCARCGNDPHARVHTALRYKVLGVVASVFVAVLFWCLPVGNPKDVPMIWTFRIGGIVVAAVFLALVVFHKPIPTLAEKMGAIPRFAPENCLACDEPLGGDSDQCPECHVRYL